MQSVISKHAFPVIGLEQHLGDLHRSGTVYWGTNRFYSLLWAFHKNVSWCSCQSGVCVILYSLPAYSNYCFLECSLLIFFFFWQAVDDGSEWKWPQMEWRESWCSGFLDFFFFLDSMRPPVLSLTVFGRLPCSISTYFSISPACCLLVARPSTTHKLTGCRVHSHRLALKGFLTGICLFPK